MPSRTVNSVARKRDRRAVQVEDGGDDVIDVREASSNLRHDPRKRARISATVANKRAARDDSPDSSSVSDVDNGPTGGAEEEGDGSDVPPPATQYDMDRDAGFKHLQHAELDDQAATQRLRRRPTQIGDNHAAENGILESITCVNFMCHVRLHCDLGPLLNFIVGENGSGKSAILTAITLCLGGKASSTNRGGSLKSFVKEGRETALLSVRIKNQGHDSYKHDVYGDSITVERQFSKSGSSGFKLKNTAGKIVSTKKHDVDEIVEYYCLQVDNPLNVLSQDQARQFLNSSSAAQKYKFFVTGVQLEQLDNDYRLLGEYIDSQEAKLPTLEASEKHAEQQKRKADELRKQLTGNQELREKKDLYRKKLVWAQVAEEERILEKYEGDVTAADVRITQAEANVADKSEVYDKVKEELDRANLDLEELRLEEVALAEQVEAAKQENDAAKKTMDELLIAEREAHQSVAGANKKIKLKKTEIKGEEERLEAANGDTVIRLRESIFAQKQKQEENEKESQAVLDQKPGLEQKLAQAKREVDEINKAVGQKRNEIMSVEEKIRGLEHHRGSAYDAYEQRMPQLLHAIDNDQGFIQKPIGPMGAHVQLQKPIWSSTIEKMLGSSLNAFVVTAKSDQQRLSGHMRRLGIKNSPILIGNRHPLNLEGKEPDLQFDTVLRVLKIDEPLVRDQLIINQMIDQVLLIKDRRDAENVMFDGAMPRNVASCLCFHDTKRGFSLRLTNKGGGNMQTSTTDPFQGKPRMKSDVDTQIGLLKESLQQINDELLELGNEKRRLQQDVQHCQADLAQNGRKLRELKTTNVALINAIAELESEMDKFEGEDGRLELLKQDLVEAISQKEHFGAQFGDITLRRQDHKKACDEALTKVGKVKDMKKDFDARITKTEAKIAKRRNIHDISLREKNAAFEERDMARGAKTQAEAKRDSQIRTAEEFNRLATEKFAGRVHIAEHETYANVEAKLIGVMQQLMDRERRIGMSEEQVNNRCRECELALETASGNLRGITNTLQMLKSTMTIRLDRWRKFQRYISASARAAFIYLLSERGFRGKLLINHKQKLLGLQVEPDETRKSATGRNTKTLSGGEKSFSSICLLISIWEAMGSPLRCLDEFDVFMDNVNRAISTNMIITAARRSVARQYILITPNAIEGRATLDKDVKIIRLTDPRQRLLADH